MNEGDEFKGFKKVAILDEEGNPTGQYKRVRVIAHQRKETVKLTPEQVAEITIIFRTFDKDGNESIDVNELKDAMKALGLNRTKAEVEALMDKADKDGSKSIDLEEFKSLMARMMKDRNVDRELERVYKLYDYDG